MLSTLLACRQVGIFGGYGKPRWQDTLGFHTVYAPVRLAKVRKIGPNRHITSSFGTPTAFNL